MTPPIVVTPAASEPVTLTEVKTHLREDLSDANNDALLNLCIAAAREHFEGQTGRRLITQTLKTYFCGWPCDAFLFDVGPIQSISWIKYYDTNDAVATYASTEYDLDGLSNPPIIRQKYLRTWPSTTLRPTNPVEIQFVAGYGAAVDVPPRIKMAILQLVATLYRHPETVTVGNSAAIASLIPQHFTAFLESYKIHV